MDKIKRSTPIRRLPPSVFKTVSQMLNVSDDKWKDLAFCIKRRNGQLRFSQLDIMTFQRHPDPAACVLDAWCTDNAKVDDLITLLTDQQLYRVADYLALEILKEEKPPRRPEDSTTGNTREIVLQTGNLDSPSPSVLAGAPGPESFGSRVPCQDTESSTETVVKTPICESQQGQDNYVNDSVVADVICGLQRQVLHENEPCEVGSEQHHAAFSVGAHKYTYSELRDITNNFNAHSLSSGGNFIGSGGFGEVFLGHAKSGMLAIKRMHVKNISELTRKQFHVEINVLSGFHHENLLPLKGYSDDSSSWCIVYPYMCNGSLEDRLARQDNTPPLTVAQRVTIGQGSARGIHHLHKGNLVHRDIKSANVLLDKNLVPKIGDCGLVHRGPSGPVETHILTNDIIGTKGYIAPEYLNYEISTKLDVYSYGVVLLELLTGLYPFDPNREDADLATHVSENCDSIIELIDGSGGQWVEPVAERIHDVAKKCLENKKRRPEMSEILPEIESWLPSSNMS